MSKKKLPFDLELVETDALVKELFNRCDGAILSLVHNLSIAEQDFNRYWEGTHLGCLGLCQDLTQVLWLDLQAGSNVPNDKSCSEN